MLLVLWQPKTSVDDFGDSLWGRIDIVKRVSLEIRFARYQRIGHEAVRQGPWRIRWQDIHEDAVQKQSKIYDVCRQKFRR